MGKMSQVSEFSLIYCTPCQTEGAKVFYPKMSQVFLQLKLNDRHFSYKNLNLKKKKYREDIFNLINKTGKVGLIVKSVC